MEMIINKDIKFGESKYYRRNTCYQDIIFNNEIIGCLISEDTNILKPVKEYYQILTLSKYKKYGDSFYISEDEGYIFLQFYTLEKFINFYNFINL